MMNCKKCGKETPFAFYCSVECANDLAPSEPRFLTAHQKAVEEAAGMPLDWGMAGAAQVARLGEPPAQEKPMSNEERAQKYHNHTAYEGCSIEHLCCECKKLAAEFANVERGAVQKALEPLRKLKLSHCDWYGYMVHKADSTGQVLEYDEECPTCVIRRALSPETILAPAKKEQSESPLS